MAEPTPVGLRITARREARGWSQRQLAMKAGISNVTLNHIERGETLAPNIAVVQQIATALGCTMEDLTGPAGSGEIPRSDAILLDQLEEIMPDFTAEQRAEFVRQWRGLTEEDRVYVLRTVRLLSDPRLHKRRGPAPGTGAEQRAD